MPIEIRSNVMGLSILRQLNISKHGTTEIITFSNAADVCFLRLLNTVTGSPDEQHTGSLREVSVNAFIRPFFVLLFICPVLAGEMVITIDDLPVVKQGRYDRQGQTAMLESVIAALNAHRVQATGFAVGNKVTGPWERDLLKRFRDAGHGLGNHTFSHPDLHRTGPGEFVADIDNCDRVLGRLAGPGRYFRYPMLHRGQDPMDRKVVQEWLKDQGYTVVPVTVDNDDYRFDTRYEEALDAGDDVAAEKIGRQYLGHMLGQVDHFRNMAAEKLGREIPHILLIHMNRINADCLDELLTHLENAGWRFISLEEALADAVYDMPDRYTGPKGVSWLERIDTQRK